MRTSNIRHYAPATDPDLVAVIDDNDLECENDEESGIHIGMAIGELNALAKAKIAYDSGEFELWAEYSRPKTLEEWKQWEDEYGKDFHKRWEGKK